MLLEKSWMLSGYGGRQKSKITVSLFAGQDTAVFANRMNQREGVTGERDGVCWQVSCTSSPVTSQDFTGSKTEEMSREHSGVQTKTKNGMEFCKFKSSEGPHSSGAMRMQYYEFLLKENWSH